MKLRTCSCGIAYPGHLHKCPFCGTGPQKTIARPAPRKAPTGIALYRSPRPDAAYTRRLEKLFRGTVMGRSIRTLMRMSNIDMKD